MCFVIVYQDYVVNKLGIGCFFEKNKGSLMRRFEDDFMFDFLFETMGELFFNNSLI